MSFALGTLDPDGSLMVPVIVDRSDWAKAIVDKSSRHTAAMSFTHTRRIIYPLQRLAIALFGQFPSEECIRRANGAQAVVTWGRRSVCVVCPGGATTSRGTGPSWLAH